MTCPRGHPIEIDDPGTVGWFDAKGEEEDDTQRFYWCHQCKTVFVFEPEWDST
jgi:hypothetical protein